MEIKKGHVNSFLRLAKDLDDLMNVIREYNPEANYYAAMDTLHLMKGSTHGNCDEPLHENSVESLHVTGLDGGDW